MHALGLFRERPAHLRRLSGVAKVSLDNRFTRRVVVSPSPPCSFTCAAAAVHAAFVDRMSWRNSCTG